eukprot:3238109-Prymnesium_polylepis.2
MRAWGCEARASAVASRALGGRDRERWLIDRVPDLCAAGCGLRRPRRAMVRDLGRVVPRLQVLVRVALGSPLFACVVHDPRRGAERVRDLVGGRWGRAISPSYTPTSEIGDSEC